MHIWNFLFCNFFHSLPQSPPADNPSSNKTMLSLLSDSANSCHSAEWVPKTGTLPLNSLFSHHSLKKHFIFQRMIIKKGYSLAKDFIIHFSLSEIKKYTFTYLSYWIDFFKLFQWILCPRVSVSSKPQFYAKKLSKKEKKYIKFTADLYTSHIFQLNSLWSDNAMLHFEASSTTTTTTQ